MQIKADELSKTIPEVDTFILLMDECFIDPMFMDEYILENGCSVIKDIDELGEHAIGFEREVLCKFNNDADMAFEHFENVIDVYYNIKNKAIEKFGYNSRLAECIALYKKEGLFFEIG